MTNVQAPMTNGDCYLEHWSLGLAHWSFLTRIRFFMAKSPSTADTRIGVITGKLDLTYLERAR